jgi:hypothetical protein
VKNLSDGRWKSGEVIQLFPDNKVLRPIGRIFHNGLLEAGQSNCLLMVNDKEEISSIKLLLYLKIIKINWKMGTRGRKKRKAIIASSLNGITHFARQISVC